MMGVVKFRRDSYHLIYQIYRDLYTDTATAVKVLKYNT